MVAFDDEEETKQMRVFAGGRLGDRWEEAVNGWIGKAFLRYQVNLHNYSLGEREE